MAFKTHPTDRRGKGFVLNGGVNTGKPPNCPSSEERTILYTKILILESSEDIKVALIELFKENRPNDSYWKQLEELFGLMHKNNSFEDALKLIGQETLPLSVRAKFIHFENAYYEYCFNIDYAQQMAEAYQYEENN